MPKQTSVQNSFAIHQLKVQEVKEEEEKKQKTNTILAIQKEFAVTHSLNCAHVLHVIHTPPTISQ